MVSLAGARVLLTGASGGLGRAAAHELSGRGAHLILTGRRADALAELAADFSGAQTIACDLASSEDAVRLAERCGDVDVLVANAGLEAARRLEDLSAAAIEEVVGVNLLAPAALTRELAPGMLARRRGHVVFVSSMAGKVVTAANGPLYTATKWGVRGLSLALREEWRGSGVGVSAVFPGPVSDAGMFASAGIRPPFGIRTRSPQAVAQAIVRAIETDVAEIDVASRLALVGELIGRLSPALLARISRRAATQVRAQMIAARDGG